MHVSICAILYIEHIPKQVRFAKRNYVVQENDGSVFITLVLDSSSSSDITVEVVDRKGSAFDNGEYTYVHVL